MSMANGGGEGSRDLPDFNLPDEILAVIPTDPYDQLDLARKITSMAIASRVTNLETEAGRLRQKLLEKEGLIEKLESKVYQLESAYQETESRLNISREENSKLWKEKDTMAMTVKKLTRDLAKLETFKRQLMQSLNEDNSPTQTVDIGTYDQSIAKAYSISDESNGFAKHHSYSTYTASANVKEDASKQVDQRYSITPYLTTPRLTPTETPSMVSASVSPRKYSVAVSPQKTSGAISPTASYDGRETLSSWYTSSQQSSAASSPPRARPLPGHASRMDGKQFFRQVRSRLSLEQFSAFLSNVKELNAQRQSREETIRKAEEIFGVENKDLYLSFQGLLNRNIR